MSCPFHEGGGLCAKTTCAILLHKELRVNIAVHVSKDIKRNTRKQKNKHKHKNKNKHKQNIAKSPVPYCFIISSELTLLSMFQNTLENTHKHKNKHRQNKKKNTRAILLHKELLLAWMELQVNIAVHVPETKPQKNLFTNESYYFGTDIIISNAASF